MKWIALPVLSVVVAGLGTPVESGAAWPSSPTVNLALSTATGDQLFPSIVSDGGGGGIFTWRDSPGVRAQRVDAAGVPQWASGGVLVDVHSTHEYYGIPAARDGAGGAILAWADSRSGSKRDIYASRVNGAGVVIWNATVCASAGNHELPVIVEDGQGGAIIAWLDRRSAAKYDVYAQRVSSDGTVQWTTDGVAVCTASGEHDWPAIHSDGQGGAIVAWQDFRAGAWDIYAQRLNASGIAQWTANGVAVCAAASSQMQPALVTDAAGGVILCWMDFRNGTDWDLYAQRVSGAGASLWTAQGVNLCVNSAGQVSALIVSDRAGGAIVAWRDLRSGAADVYAQRVSAAGALLWGATGTPVCTATGNQLKPALVSDAGNGAVIVWPDQRGGATADLYAQRLNAAGAPQWASQGVQVCAASNDQFFFQHEDKMMNVVLTDGAGGALVTWEDSRSSGAPDIYAQRIDPNGVLGGTVLNVAEATSRTGPVVAPNPALGSAWFRSPIGTAGERVEVVDLAGRVLWSSPLDAGGARWRGTSAFGSQAAPGVYFARFSAGSVGRVVRFVWLR